MQRERTLSLEQVGGQPSLFRAPVAGPGRAHGLIYAALATVVWVGVGLSAQTGAGTAALLLFNVLTLGFLALLALRWRARTSDSFTGRWQWWLVAVLVVVRVLAWAAAAAGLPLLTSAAWIVGLAGATWLVTSAPSGRRVSIVQGLEVMVSLLFATLACLHSSRVAWVLIAGMGLLRLLAKANRERGNLYLAVFVLLLVDAALGKMPGGALATEVTTWPTLAPGLPLIVLTWAVALGMPKRARRWCALPVAAQRLCGRIPLLVVLAVASCGLLLLQHGDGLAVIASVLALLLCMAHQVLLRRHNQQLAIVPEGIPDAEQQARQVVQTHLQRILGQGGRSDSSCSVLMVDVDRFSAFNLRYGTRSGDAVLARVENTLQAGLMRAGDQVARWRGDSFLVVLPNTSAADAPVVARRLLKAVQGLGIGHAATDSGVVTVSIGAASRPAWRRQQAAALLREAGLALQRAKGDGRNRWDSDVLPFDGVGEPPLLTSAAS